MNENTLVVVTGGTGHLGGHTIVALLRDGYRVRTTVRSLEREAQVRAAVAAGGADPAGLEVVAADLSADDGWAAALKGADYAETTPALREAVSRLGRIPVIDTTKARTVLGWTPRTVETTIADTADSLLAQDN